MFVYYYIIAIITKVVTHLRRVVVDEEVVVYLAPGHVHRGGAVRHGGEEGLAVPAVKGTC